MGNARIAIKAERKCNRNMITTTLTMTASSIKSRWSVVIESRIKPERSYPGMISMPAGRDGAISRQLPFHPFDDIQRVLSLAHDDDAADGFAFAIPFRGALANVRTKADTSDIAHQLPEFRSCCPRATDARSSRECR